LLCISCGKPCTVAEDTNVPTKPCDVVEEGVEGLRDKFDKLFAEAIFDSSNNRGDKLFDFFLISQSALLESVLGEIGNAGYDSDSEGFQQGLNVAMNIITKRLKK